MRLGFVSDIHIDINKQWAMASAIAESAKALRLDRLYVVGDISNYAGLSLSFVEQVKEKFGVETYLIPGNHDYYAFDESFGRMRHQFLHTFPHIIDGVGIMADTGWYDYTWLQWGSLARAMRGKTEDNGTTWPDHRFINYPKTISGDPARWLSKVCINNLHRQAKILDAQNISHRIVATHMIPNKKFLIDSSIFCATNCFFGGDTLQECIEDLAPDFAFFGHTHTSYDEVLNGTHYICSPIGYMDFEHSEIADPLEYAIKHIVIYDTKKRGITN